MLAQDAYARVRLRELDNNKNTIIKAGFLIKCGLFIFYGFFRRAGFFWRKTLVILQNIVYNI